jgi:hypothetical protein
MVGSSSRDIALRGNFTIAPLHRPPLQLICSPLIGCHLSQSDLHSGPFGAPKPLDYMALPVPIENASAALAPPAFEPIQ